MLCKKWETNLFAHGFSTFSVSPKNNSRFLKSMNICIVIHTNNKAVFMNYSYQNGKLMILLHRLLKIKCTHTHANNTPHI